MLKIFIKLFLFYFLFSILACKSESPKVDPIPTNEVTMNQGPTQLVVNLNKLRIRDQPGPKGKEVGQLLMGTKLEDLGEVSDFTTKVKLRGVAYDEPWIKVKTSDEVLEGWVYAGGVSFDLNNPTDLSQRLLEKRLQSMFGKEMTSRLSKYRRDYQTVKTSSDFAKVYSEGTYLRDTLMRRLADKVEIENPQELPDLFWLENVMPGFVPAVVAEGTAYYMFWDYKKMMVKTTETTGKEDDDFNQLCFMIHAMDSIEHFFPSWFMQTWDYGGSSLLGKGVHQKVFSKVNELSQNSPLFENELEGTKNRLIEDMTSVHTEYWESQKDILREIDAIIKANYKVLSKADQLALPKRRKQFEKPKANKIKLNQRAGY